MAQFKYIQLAEKLRKAIKDGVWLPDDKLPSIRQLAQQYQLSKISVQHALQFLEAQGELVAKAKSGYFVNEIKTTLNNTPESLSLAQPKLVEVPDVFYDIMSRSAAFDITPSSPITLPRSNHLDNLNRNINKAMRQHQQRNAYYYGAPSGDELLKQQIALRYKKRGVEVEAADICITQGCQNSLYLSLLQVCQAGDIVAVESPAFYGVLQLLQHLKLKIVEIPSSFTRGISPEDLSRAAQKWPIKACILTPTYATPTGASMSDEQKAQIVAVAKENDFTLIEDDIYGDLGFHEETKPLKAFDTDNRVILCSSLSKVLSRDLRIGWTISASRAKGIAQAKLVNHLANSQAIQEGVAQFMMEGHYDRYLPILRRRLLNQREQLLVAIKQYWKTSVHYTVPDGGLSLWLKLEDRIDTMSLYNQAIKQSIVITPGNLFSSQDKFSSYLRLTFVQPTVGERLEAIKTLGSLLAKI